MRRLAIVTVFLVLTLSGVAPARAQGSRAEIEALKREVETLEEALKAQTAARESQAAILKELQEIKALLRETPSRGATAGAGAAVSPADVVLSVDGAAFKGSPSARLVLIEFADYQTLTGFTPSASVWNLPVGTHDRLASAFTFTYADPMETSL